MSPMSNDLLKDGRFHLVNGVQSLQKAVARLQESAGCAENDQQRAALDYALRDVVAALASLHGPLTAVNRLADGVDVTRAQGRTP